MREELPVDGGVSLEDVRELLNAHPWRFAKSMPENPHWYSLHEHWDRKTFERVVLYIRAHGYQRRWGRRVFTYLELDGYKYWTMGFPLERTRLINCAKAD